MINEEKEKKILLLSFFAGLLFAIAELIFAICSHSQSVLMDAVYDATELVFIALILFLTPLFHKPISEKYPYGFFQVESIFLIIKGFMMLSVSLGVTTDIIGSALSGGNPVNEVQISIFQLCMALVSVLIFAIMKRMNHAASSPTVDAELLGWKLDICYSLGMSLAFLLSIFLKKTPLAPIAPYFDSIVAVLVMILMIPETIRMLSGAIKDIFLFSPDEETVDQIKEICTNILTANHFHPQFFDITRTGRHVWASIYFQTPDNALLMQDLKRITDAAHQEIGSTIENCTCEFIVVP